jgi:hypothetical protein
MASRMRNWIGAVLVGLALVSIWQLPPDSVQLHEGTVVKGEELALNALRIETRDAIETLRRFRWSDSLTALAFAEQVDDVVLLYAERETLNDVQVDRFEAVVRREVAAAGGSAGEMLFGYVFQDHRANATEQTGNSGTGRVETYTGWHEGRPYCLQVRPVRTEWDQVRISLSLELSGTDQVRPRTNVLGECAFYLRYGMPGDAVQAWLERGATFYGIERSVDREGLPGSMRRSVFGMQSIGNRPVETYQCLAGNAAACAFLFAYPAETRPLMKKDLAIVAASPATSLGGYSQYRSSVSGDAYLLGDLEAEMGREAFAQFWASEAPEIEDAFQGAFGTDAGAWLLSWISQSMGVDTPGPRLPRSASSGSMIAIALLLGLAWSVQRRRQVV